MLNIIIKSIQVIFIVTLITACATPTISNNIYTIPLDKARTSVGDDLSHSVLLGGNGMDWVTNISCSSNDQFTVFGGTHKSFGESTDFIAINSSLNNNILWAKTYGGPHKDSLFQADKVNDGGYLLLGESRSLFYTMLPGHKTARPLILKISDKGTPEWSVLLNPGSNSLVGQLVDYHQTNDGGYIFVGQSRFGNQDNYKWDIAMVKLNNTGELIWNKRYQNTFDSRAVSVIESPDSNIIIVGHTQKNGPDALSNELVLLKTDKNGRLKWEKNYRPESGVIYPNEVLLHKNNIIVTGLSLNKRNNYFSSKITLDGKLTWAKLYDIPEEISKLPIASTVLSNGKIVMAGFSGAKKVQPRNGDYIRGMFGLALVINPAGDMDYFTHIGGDRDEEIRALQPLNRGKLCVALNTESFGATFSDILVTHWESKNRTNQDISQNIPFTFNVSNSNVSVSEVEVNHESLPANLITVKDLIPVTKRKTN